jgi:hypothetical protein
MVGVFQRLSWRRSEWGRMGMVVCRVAIFKS